MSDPRHFRAIDAPVGPRVLLATGTPTWAGDDTASDIDMFGVTDAIASLTRATFASGGEIVAAAGTDTSLLLAALALDYMAQRAAEVDAESRRILVTAVESAGDDPQLRQALAPYQLRGAVRLVDIEGRPVAPDSEWLSQEPVPPEQRVHPVTPSLVARWRPTFAVFIAPDQVTEAAMRMLSNYDVPFSVIGPTSVDPGVAERWSSHDPVRDIDRREAELRWLDREPDEETRAAPPVVPYPLVMQRLVARWP